MASRISLVIGSEKVFLEVSYLDNNEELYNRLNSELGQINTEVQNLLVDQHIFYEVQSIIKSNSNIQKPNTFNRWMAKSYGNINVCRRQTTRR